MRKITRMRPIEILMIPSCLLLFCCLLPPHLPQHRQQQKTNPVTAKAMAKTTPRSVTTKTGAHHAPYWVKRRRRKQAQEGSGREYHTHLNGTHTHMDITVDTCMGDTIHTHNW